MEETNLFKTGQRYLKLSDDEDTILPVGRSYAEAVLRVTGKRGR